MLNKIGISNFVVNLIFQKLLRYNNKFKYMIHFTSRVRNPEGFYILDSEKKSSVLKRCLAESPGVYIQAKSGIYCSDDLYLAPGVKLISSNHDPKDLKKHIESRPINIGGNVWIGANSIILPGVTIGSNVVIGAGSVVSKSIPENTTAVGNPCRVIRENVCS